MINRNGANSVVDKFSKLFRRFVSSLRSDDKRDVRGRIVVASCLLAALLVAVGVGLIQDGADDPPRAETLPAAKFSACLNLGFARVAERSAFSLGDYANSLASGSSAQLQAQVSADAARDRSDESSDQLGAAWGNLRSLAKAKGETVPAAPSDSWCRSNEPQALVDSGLDE